MVPNAADNGSKDWKNHPVLIAVISAAATATFFQTVVIPISDAGNRAELIELRKAKATHEGVEKAFVEEKRRAAQLAKDLAVSQQANLFLSGNPYPMGYRGTPIGMPLSKLKEQFKNETVTDQGSVLTIELKSGIFRRVSYHYESNGKEQVVSHIAYQVSFNDRIWDKENADTLVAIMKEVFGPPTEVKERIGSRWHIASAGKTYWLYAWHDLATIVVTDTKTRLKFW